MNTNPNPSTNAAPMTRDEFEKMATAIPEWPAYVVAMRKLFEEAAK